MEQLAAAARRQQNCRRRCRVSCCRALALVWFLVSRLGLGPRHTIMDPPAAAGAPMTPLPDYADLELLMAIHDQEFLLADEHLQLAPLELGRRSAPDDPDPAPLRSAKKQDSEMTAAERMRAARPAMVLLSNERALADWRWALSDLTLVDALMLISLLLKMLGALLHSSG